MLLQNLSFYMINNRSVKFDKDLKAGSVFRRMTLTYGSLYFMKETSQRLFSQVIGASRFDHFQLR